MNFRIPRALSTFGISGLLTLAGGCTGSPKGQLMVAVQTDMSVPEDINTLRIEVFDGNGALTARVDNEIRPFAGRNGIFMPGTLGVVEGSTRGERVEIRVASKYKYESSDYEYDPQIDDPEPEGVFRTLREVVTTLPVGRVAVLPLPIQWLCSEDPDVPAGDRSYLSQRGDEVENECPADQTCVAGTCVENEVAEEDLSEFDEDDPLSTGMLGDGTCFDTTGCFEAAQLVVPDFNGDDECTLQVDDVDQLNIALFTGRREAGDTAAPAETGDEDAGVSTGDAPGASVGGASSGGAASGGAASAGETSDDGESRPSGGAAASAGASSGTPASAGRSAGPSSGGSTAGTAPPPPGAELPAPQFKGTDGATAGRVGPSGAGGVCFEDGLCLVPLDKDNETGWREGSGSGEVRLPVAVCRRIEEGRVQGVAISTSCESKTPSAPICGAWLEDGDDGTSTSAPDVLVTLTRPQGFVDNLDDGTEEFELGTGETGTWTASVDGSNEDPEIIDDEDTSHGKVIRFSGNLGDLGNDGTTGVGFLFDEDYDASDYGGIRFFARAEEDGEHVLITARPREYIPVELGGECASNCPAPTGYLVALTTAWKSYTVSFDDLFAASEVGSADQVGGVAFFPQDAGDFEFFVDDIQFLTGDVVSTPPDEVPDDVCSETNLFGELLVELEDTRACDPDAQDACDMQVALDDELGLYLYVTDDAQAIAAKEAYEDYQSELAMCPDGNTAPAAGGAPVGEPVGPHCIPTGDGAGVCSAVGSPFFSDPGSDPVECDAEPRQVGDLIDDFEDADIVTAFGSEWMFVDEAGMLDDTIEPTALGAYDSNYGLSVPAGTSALVLFDDACPIDTSSYIGVSFYARSDGSAEETLVFAFGTESSSSVEGCAMGTEQCPTPSDSPFANLTTEWGYHEVFFSDFGLSGADGIIDAVIQSSSGFSIDDIRFLTASVQPSSTCGDYLIEGDEVCDDGDAASTGGCSADCQAIQPGYICTREGTSSYCYECGTESAECCTTGANNAVDGMTEGAAKGDAECDAGLICDPELEYCVRPSSDVCGQDGQDCCDADPPCGSGLICDIELDYCRPGMQQNPQQFGSCSVADGLRGECWSNEVCYQGTCSACGTEAAGADLCCEANSCADADHRCIDYELGYPADATWSTTNFCSPCGDTGQACCAGDVCNNGGSCLVEGQLRYCGGPP